MGGSALQVGIGGLMAQSNKLAAIADNLANINTVGYKLGATTFQNLLANDAVIAYSPGGATSLSRQLNNIQGPISNTSSPTDIAISGTGFFPVRQTPITTGELLYTRAGAFAPDANGDFVNGAGFYLLGWLLEDEALPSSLDEDMVDFSTGSSALQPINPSSLTASSVETTLVSLIANLKASTPNYAGTPAYDATDTLANMADGGVAPNFSKPLTIVDSTGEEHSVTIGFLKTGANSWAVEVYATTAAELSTASAQVASGSITFNGDGTLASVTGTIASAVSMSWDDPAAATNSITFNWGTAGALGTGLADGLSQLDAPFKSISEQNGFAAGSLRDITITSDGFVVGNYGNGLSRRLYQIPLTVFTEQNELESRSGNVYAQTFLSGDVNFVRPGSDGFATLFSSALEGSNVDVATQMADMIIAQRNYQFNSKSISVSDELMETATRMAE
jgi:flagellar hook protein FlgE